MDRAGRRIPWLLSASTCGVFLLYLAVYTNLSEKHHGPITQGLKHGGNGAIAFVMLYSLLYVHHLAHARLSKPDVPATASSSWSFGGKGLPWIVSSEIFPSRLRSITGAFSAMSQWLASFVSTEAFPHMVASRMGVWGTFLFFSCCCFSTLSVPLFPRKADLT